YRAMHGPSADYGDRPLRQEGHGPGGDWLERSVCSRGDGCDARDRPFWWGWRFMWPGCILESPLTHRALTICTYISINMYAGNGWRCGKGPIFQRRWPWKR